MKTDCSFDSEAESNDSESETIISMGENPKQHIDNLPIIKSISVTLSTILEKNEKLPNYKEILKEQKNICFNSYLIPEISLYEYLIRIQKYSLIEKNTLISALVYIDKFCKKSKIMLTYYNIHKIIFAAILISIKFNEDGFFDNEFYSQIAGIKKSELNNIEYHFFYMCDFNIFVSEESFEKYNKCLNNTYEKHYGNKSNFNTKIIEL
jgi:hypothetical protein